LKDDPKKSKSRLIPDSHLQLLCTELSDSALSETKGALPANRFDPNLYPLKDNSTLLPLPVISGPQAASQANPPVREMVWIRISFIQVFFFFFKHIYMYLS
jgi:hypothetical protein